jgi:hypothetical protein
LCFPGNDCRETEEKQSNSFWNKTIILIKEVKLELDVFYKEQIVYLEDLEIYFLIQP